MNKTLRTYMTYSRAPFKLWSKPVLVPLLGFSAYSDTAFSGAILRNGSLVAMTRSQVIVASHWNDTSSYRQATSFSPNHYGEGAHVWVDEGGAGSGSSNSNSNAPVVHMLSHNGNLDGTTCGKHYFAAGDDLTRWSTNGCAYQSKDIACADGSTASFGRRERPHVVFDRQFDATTGQSRPTRIIAFSSAVTALPTECIGKPRCLKRWPDASYTLLQGILTDDRRGHSAA